jgi:hypothetical protein
MADGKSKNADLRVKHLEMLQAAITRMSNQSAALKNFCVTLITAVAGFTITLGKPAVGFFAVLPVLAFAFLDARYLQLERQFRNRFERVRKADWNKPTRFEMNPDDSAEESLSSCLCSWSIKNFYGPLFILVVLAVLIGGYFYGRFI